MFGVERRDASEQSVSIGFLGRCTRLIHPRALWRRGSTIFIPLVGLVAFIYKTATDMAFPPIVELASKPEPPPSRTLSVLMLKIKLIAKVPPIALPRIIVVPPVHRFPCHRSKDCKTIDTLSTNCCGRENGEG